jgi:hypothetical protein
MNEPDQVTGGGGCFARVFSMLIGPGLLLVLAVLVASRDDKPGSMIDIVYGIVLALTIIVKIWDKPAVQQAEGKSPKAANISPTARYAIVLFVTGCILWCLAHFILKNIF